MLLAGLYSGSQQPFGLTQSGTLSRHEVLGLEPLIPTTLFAEGNVLGVDSRLELSLMLFM